MTSKQLIELLPILDENILAELANQPGLFVEAARYRVSKMRKVAETFAKFEQWRAELALQLRARKTVRGDKQLTENAIKEKLQVSPRNRRLRAELDRAHEEEEFSKLLLSAFRMRNTACEIISESQKREGPGISEAERIAQHRKLVRHARELEERRKRVNDEEGDE